VLVDGCTSNCCFCRHTTNLNLIERFWKFLRKKVTRNTYYAIFADFRVAIQRLLANLARTSMSSPAHDRELPPEPGWIG
jgi:hypothetical protein